MKCSKCKVEMVKESEFTRDEVDPPYYIKGSCVEGIRWVREILSYICPKCGHKKHVEESCRPYRNNTY